MGRHKKKIRSAMAVYFDPLLEVGTVSEVAEMCHVAPRTVRMWCEFGYIAARPSTAGRGWIISLPSVRDYVRENYQYRHRREKRLEAG